MLHERNFERVSNCTQFVAIADDKVSCDSESSGVAEHVVRYFQAFGDRRSEVAQDIHHFR